MLKRFVDIVGATISVVLLSPFILGVAILVRLQMGSPVLFTQVRPGLNGKPFKMIKFRTMRDLRDELGNPLPDAERLTRFGRFLRSTSLDELPELINVLRGEMSICGPRPLLMQYLPLYTPEQARRHEVKPGITGWAQVNGRNALSWDDKFALDIWYVDNHSFRIDARIMWMTIVKVFKREGIGAGSEDTPEAFLGRNRQQS